MHYLALKASESMAGYISGDSNKQFFCFFPGGAVRVGIGTWDGYR